MAGIAVPHIALRNGNWNDRPYEYEMSLTYELRNANDEWVDTLVFNVAGDMVYVNDSYDRCWQDTREVARACLRELKKIGYKNTAFWQPTYV